MCCSIDLSFENILTLTIVPTKIIKGKGSSTPETLKN